MHSAIATVIRLSVAGGPARGAVTPRCPRPAAGGAEVAGVSGGAFDVGGRGLYVKVFVA